VRERIASWDGAKGALIDDILGERDTIDESGEGQSFRAFWELLMSQARQEQMTERLQQVLAQSAIVELAPDRRLRRVHYDWLEAGEHTQRTVALLSSQLRRFLDDTAWHEDRRIIELLHSIEANALALRDDPAHNRPSDCGRPKSHLFTGATRVLNGVLGHCTVGGASPGNGLPGKSAAGSPNGSAST
jgi:Protein of unknown function (DUF3375)